ncbi:hypothetical protein SAMN04487968_105217 [Nocardioides terrae]|uniref:Uncharacterized protein n=2 Tax=Nocardioides terrae TaxID=574651 RepID=A0A1I1IB86_9ACTN|nr:hypothetical protein SAMN04487968_105217 [Nocardioides terrae]
MATFSMVLMIAVVIGVVVLILLFERRRARQIERDLKARAQPRHAPGGTEPQGVQPRENDRRES